MPAAKSLASLRRSLAAVDASYSGFAPERPPLRFGLDSLDQALGDGLARGALHEMYAGGVMDGPAAAGFALALMLRGAEGRKLVWIRQDMAARELGELYGPGLAEYGAEPSALIAIRVRDALAALRAGKEVLRCGALGGVAIELLGEPKALDLTATRRLARAAAASGVTAFLVRMGAQPMPSAAQTRWRVTSAPSVRREANAPGAPTFKIDLLRHRAGLPPRSFRVEWDRDQFVFREPALSRFVAASTVHRPPASADAPLRRAG